MTSAWSIQDFLDAGYHFQIDDTSIFSGIAINLRKNSILPLTPLQIELIKQSDLIRGVTNTPNIWVYGVKS